MDTPNRMYYYAMLCNANTLIDTVERDLFAIRKIITELTDDVYFNDRVDTSTDDELYEEFTRGLDEGYREGYNDALIDILDDDNYNKCDDDNCLICNPEQDTATDYKMD